MAALIFLLLLVTLYAATRSDRGWVTLLFLVTLALTFFLFLHHATDPLNINL